MSKERIGPFINVASSILLPSSCRSFWAKHFKIQTHSYLD
jgi:hypothetical protein